MKDRECMRPNFDKKHLSLSSTLCSNTSSWMVIIWPFYDYIKYDIFAI